MIPAVGEVRVIEKLLLKLRVRDEVSAEEARILRESIDEVRTVPADTTIVRASQHLSASTLLLGGLMCRYKDLRDGSRQIAELQIAGDFVDLHGFTLKRLDHSVMALSECRIATVPHDRLRRITEERPHLTRLLWLLTILDAAIHREWLVSLGQRSSAARMANLFCELHVRLSVVELTDDLEYDLDLTQEDLANCLGITAVHANRTLKALRDRGLVDFHNRRVRIIDLAGLREIAEFDPTYLQLNREPR